MYDCGSCDDCFCDAYGLEVHLDDYQHERVECETCTRTFKTWASCRQHMNAIDHWSKPYSCDTCSMVFRNYAETESHMDNRGHWKHYCADCQEHFQNENNLRMVRWRSTSTGNAATDFGHSTSIPASTAAPSSSARSAGRATQPPAACAITLSEVPAQKLVG